MEWIVIPTDTTDHNLIPWVIVGHEDHRKVKGKLATIKLDCAKFRRESGWKPSDPYDPTPMVNFLRNLGYTVIYPATLEWVTQFYET